MRDPTVHQERALTDAGIAWTTTYTQARSHGSRLEVLIKNQLVVLQSGGDDPDKALWHFELKPDEAAHLALLLVRAADAVDPDRLERADPVPAGERRRTWSVDELVQLITRVTNANVLSGLRR
jgi:hypothetical protein